MQLNDFDFELPEELIAQEPSERRDRARMLAVDRGSSSFRDDDFANFPQRLRRGDVLVLNNTKVFPARLYGTTDTGARVEVLLTTRCSETSWQALARPTRRLKPGKAVTFGNELTGRIESSLPDGQVEIEFEIGSNELDAAIERVGRTPLPPYIRRDSDAIDKDRERYQTVYASSSGAIAAPTAGLHFTDAVLSEIRAEGITIAEVTLHVGYGTFEPVRVDDIAKHSVRPERYEILPETVEVLNAALRESRRIVAVGTTTTRTLESFLQQSNTFTAASGFVDLTITPGYKFKAVDALLTNFHLPRSSLLILVSTFGGHELIMKAYRHAVASHYRFYSYGDCMFIE
jgi:S-adenosylmethionine:tRNA ribosyltransferase-isomerase